jgi:uncharacterized protein YjbI with pentapeptide repeats
VNFVASEATWKFNRAPGTGWQAQPFDETGWGFALAPSDGLCTSGVPTPHIAEPMWAPNPVSGETVYFRKVFTLAQLPSTATIYTVFEDTGDLYVNGTLVRTDSNPVVDAAPMSDDVTSLLQVGLNVIALRVTDVASPCQSVQVALSFVDPITNLALTVDHNQAPAGLSQVPLGSIPVEAIAGSGNVASAGIRDMSLASSQLSSIQLSSIQLSSIALASSQLSSIQLSSIPITRPGGWDAVLEGTALQGVPLQDVTLGELAALSPPPAALAPSSPDPLTIGQVDLSSTALRSLSLAAIALGGTQLSSIAVPSPAADWCAAIAAAGSSCADVGHTPADIGNATLIELNVKGVQLSSIQLSSIQLSSIALASSQLSSIQLSSIQLSSIQLSSIQLSSIQLSSITLPGGALASVQLSSIALPPGASDWCVYFAANGPSCITLGISEASTLHDVAAALALQSIPVAASALGAIQLSSIQLSSIQLSSIQLSSIPLTGIAIAGTQLSSIQLSSIQLSSIAPNASQLSSIQLSSIANVANVVDCTLVNCATDTLGHAGDLHAIKPGATIGDLGSYGAVTVQNILTDLGAAPSDVSYFLSFFYGNLTVGDVANNPVLNLGQTTLGQLLLALLVKSDYPWENLPLGSINSPLVPGNGTPLNYTATFNYAGPPAVAPTLLSVTLPDTFVYLPGSTTITVANTGGPTTLHIEPTVTGDVVAWGVPGLQPADAVQIAFQVRAGLRLGTQTSAIAALRVPFPEVDATLQAPVTIGENFEPNDDPTTAPVIAPDTLYLSHISSASDRDFFRIPANLQPGARVQVLLSHQSQDNDVALFSPSAAQLRPSTAPPLQSVPLADDGQDINSAGNNPQPQTLQDIQLGSSQLSSIQLSSISANRGISNESVAALSTDTDSGFYTVQIGGYNGAFGVDPYVLRLKVTAPPPEPACAARTFAHAGEGVAGTTPASLASDVNTLFLVSKKRLGDTYGAAAADNVMSSLTALAGRSDLGVRGAVLSVEGSAPVAAAYAAWDANPCSPTKANAVVTAINALVDQYRPSLPQLQNIVVVGADEIVPFARIPDLTQVSNESDFTADAQAIDGSPEFASSFITQNILSDDAYADFNPTPWLNRQIFVPQVAIGRLIETPDQIVGQVTQFTDFNGRLDPSTALTTGYDFLTDGAQEVAGSLDTLVGLPNSHQLISGSWTSADLKAKLNNATPVPDVLSLNAHFDQYRLLPGAGNTTNDESDLYTTADIARAQNAPQLLDGRIIFSMGCHAGLNAPDFLVGSPNADQAARLLDWPETFADQGAAVYVANTGYGYGDTDTVAYSEKVMSLFSARLGSKTGSALTIGQALTYAKQEYFGSLVQYEEYDQKAMQEATFYGLPMFRIGPAVQTPPPTPSTLPFATDPLTGLQSVAVNSTPSFSLVNLGPKGSYYTSNGGAEGASGHPIEPEFNVDLPPSTNGSTAHGIVVTGLQSSDTHGFNAVFSSPSTDASVPEESTDTIFPSSIHNLTTFQTPFGPQQRAVFMPGQFLPETGQLEGTGVQRLFTGIQATVLYSNSSDVTPPTIIQTHSAIVGANASFVVEAVDDLPNNMNSVFVLFRPESASTWSPLSLVNEPGTDRWTGSAPASGPVEYMVYAIDKSGNVALSTNKGEFHHTESAGSSGLTLAVVGTLAGGGWYHDASITVTGDAGVTFETSIDGQPFQPYAGPVPITGPGVHVVSARGSDASNGTAIVPVDATPPTVTITAPALNAVLLKNQPVSAIFNCGDAGSGVATCAGTLANNTPIDTSVSGPGSFQVTASDIAGNLVTVTHPYTVSTCMFGNTACDGLPDAYKLAQPCFAQYPLTQDISALDTDGDGLTNLQEFVYGTNPCNPDTDGDGYSDKLEVQLGKNPATYCPIMRADVTGDGTVSILDLSAVAGYMWQSVPPAPARYDQDHDGHISILDLSAMAGTFMLNVSQCP